MATSTQAELTTSSGGAEDGTEGKRAGPHRFTSEEAREAAKLRGSGRTKTDAVPTDADIEDGLRRKAKNDPRAAEVLLRWQAAHMGSDSDAVQLDLDTWPIEVRERAQVAALQLVEVLARDDEESERVLEALGVTRAGDPPVPPRASESRPREVSGEPPAAIATSAPRTFDDPPPPRSSEHAED